MPRHPPDTLSSLTTFIDHRHDPSGEELALGRVTSGRAGNGTNDQQRVTCGDACFAGTRPIAKKVLDDSCPTERPKWAGSRCVFPTLKPPHIEAARDRELALLNLIIHLSKSTSRFENPRQKSDRLSHATPSNTGEFIPAGANLLRLDDEPSGTVKAPFVCLRHRLFIGDLGFEGNRRIRAG